MPGEELSRDRSEIEKKAPENLSVPSSHPGPMNIPPDDLIAFLNKTGGRIEITQVTSGPYPDPQTLAQYKAVDPDFPKQIMRQAQLEQSNRHHIEKAPHRLATLGVIASVVIGALGFSTAAYFAHIGAPGYGTTIAGGTLLGMMTSILTHTMKKQTDAAEESKSDPDE